MGIFPTKLPLHALRVGLIGKRERLGDRLGPTRGLFLVLLQFRLPMPIGLHRRYRDEPMDRISVDEALDVVPVGLSPLLLHQETDGRDEAAPSHRRR